MSIDTSREIRLWAKQIVSGVTTAVMLDYCITGGSNVRAAYTKTKQACEEGKRKIDAKTTEIRNWLSKKIEAK